MIEVERVDFVSVPTRDVARARRFYGEVLGIALAVPDVAAARERLTAQGVEFLGDTIDTGVCLMGFFYDPDGNVFILHHRYAPRVPAPIREQNQR